MDQSFGNSRSAILTAISGQQLAAVGNIIEGTATGLRVEITLADHPGSLSLGELYRIESGDDVIVSELLAYRWSDSGACLLLSIVHRASVRVLELLARAYQVECELEAATPAVRPAPHAATRRVPGLSIGMRGVIARLRMPYAPASGSPSPKLRFMSVATSAAHSYLREMVTASPPC